jgi:hypothetical protein
VTPSESAASQRETMAAQLLDAAAAYLTEQWPYDVWVRTWLASYDMLINEAPNLARLLAEAELEREGMGHVSVARAGGLE